jgi:hypothetical protein
MSEDEVRDWLRRLRWPADGNVPICPSCGSEAHGWIATRQQYRCDNSKCRHGFSVTAGTIWHDHRLPLHGILEAAFHFSIARSGLSALRLSETMKLDPKVAHVTLHKFREAQARRQALLRLCGWIEIDCVFFPGSWRRPNLGRSSPATYGTRTAKAAALTLSQRDGPTIAIPVSGETKRAALEAVSRYVVPGSTIFSDESGAFKDLHFFGKHLTVKHAVEFVSGQAHVNNDESLHSRLKAAQRGVYKRMASGRDFDLYLAEMAFRQSLTETDTRRMCEAFLGASLQSPPSDRFKGYFQRHILEF